MRIRLATRPRLPRLLLLWLCLPPALAWSPFPFARPEYASRAMAQEIDSQVGQQDAASGVQDTRAQPASRAVPAWRLETAAAGWTPRDSQAEVVFRDRLWLMGGWFNSYEAPPRDVWNSLDGRRWEQVQTRAPWKHSDLAMAVVHRDAMWLLGGWYNGRLPGHSASNEVWRSTDGVDWQLVTSNAGWSPRIAAGLVVFQGKMWLLGGTENYYFGDRSSLRNDVWSSEDGKIWTRVIEQAPWSPRAYHQAVVLNDRIYVMGGGNYVPQYEARNDVWSSADGVEWRRETEAAPWSPRLWFSSVVYRNRIFVLGGWSSPPYRNWGDVWCSADGRHWERLESPASWKARHEHSAYVFQDRLWIAGGHAQPLSSEVWSLHLPQEFFTSPQGPAKAPPQPPGPRPTQSESP